MVGILTFLERGSSIISILKGVNEDGRYPLSDEALLFSMGG